MKRLICTVLVLGWAGAALAEDRGGALELLKQERQAIDARYEQAMRDCAGRFALNACQQQAKDQRQAALKPVQQREYQLHAQEREERALQQRERVKARQAEAARREAQAASAVAPIEAATPAAPPATAEPFEARSQQRVRRSIDLSEQAHREAAQKQQAAQARERAAAAHREAVLKRNAERLERRPAAAPLPVPSAPSAPAR